MATYRIEVLELHRRTVEVEAASRAEAIALAIDGNDITDCGAECDGLADHLGMWADEYPELAAECKAEGIDIDDVIPAIHSIEEV